MFGNIGKSILNLLKKITVLLVFLALTFMLLELMKYLQDGQRSASTAIIEDTATDEDEAIPVAAVEKASVPVNETEMYDEYLSILEGYTELENVEADAPEEPEVQTPEIVPVEEDTAEETYKLYEEELPKDIKIEPSHKPASFGDMPVIAIVIDDMGISRKRTKDINKLNYPLTSSFLTYGDDLHAQISASLNAGHEVMAHIPMEAKTKVDAAPDVLKTSMSGEEVVKRLSSMLHKFEGIKGINNHMGSKFTENEAKMGDIMLVLRDKDLFFLDSRTSPKSVGKKAAEKSGVPYATRNIFLDNDNDFEYILGQLKATEKVAKKNGYAVAIGHPKSQTYLALKYWLPTLENKKIKLVHLSEIVEALNENIETLQK